MANIGKYVDRNPDIRTAGKIIEKDYHIGDTLKNYSIHEHAKNIMDMKCKRRNEDAKIKDNLGFSSYIPVTTLSELISPELKKSRFVTFREKFLEAMFFKKPELGKALSLSSKPDKLTNENTTYGKINEKSPCAYKIILPQKKTEQVNNEYVAWHDKYLISHNHYLPSEQINRHYNENFNRKGTFGVSTHVDKSGKMVKRCLTQNDHLVVISNVQRKYLNRTRAELGTRIDRFEMNLDSEKIYGMTNKPDKCNAQALIENLESCNQRNPAYEIMAYINKIRRYLFNRSDFHINDLKNLLKKYDKADTGYLSFEEIFKAIHYLFLRLNEKKLREAAIFFKMVKDEGMPTEQVKWETFWKMLHIQHTLPIMNDIKTVPKNLDNKHTTYRLMCCDRTKHLSPNKISKDIKIKLNDDIRTRASDVIAPDIPMHYGLDPSDFEELRSKEDLRKIFKRVLKDNFDTIWDLARVKLDGPENCLISVNQLRESLNVFNAKLAHN